MVGVAPHGHTQGEESESNDGVKMTKYFHSVLFALQALGSTPIASVEHISGLSWKCLFEFNFALC